MSYNVSGFLKEKDIEFSEHVSIKKFSSIKIEATARYLVLPASGGELAELISFLSLENIPFRVVGRMSNILPSTALYKGVLIKTDKIGSKTMAERQCTVGCGARLSRVIFELAKENLGGLEALFHIPGSLGGMVYSNAGAYGCEVSDVFVCGSFYSRREDRIMTLSAEEMKFGYRRSIMSKDDVYLLSATLRLKDMPCEHVKNELVRLGRLRRESQPLEYPSLGSIFKRNGNTGAGYYIDKVGLKGFTVGGASVSKKHAGFIINLGGATPTDVLRLIEIIKERVYRIFGVELREEIKII